MESLLDGSEGIAPLDGIFGRCELRPTDITKGDARLQTFRVPARDEGRDHRLGSSWCNPEEVDKRHLGLIGLFQPPIVGRIRIRSHEGIVDGLIGIEDLPVHVTLVIVPDLAPGFGNTVLMDSK